MGARGKGCLSALLIVMGIACITSSVLGVENPAAGGKVAVVNGSVITQEDFDREMGRIRAQLASSGKSIDDSQWPAMRDEVLESLIDRELLYQESHAKGIRIEETTINEKLGELKKRFPNEDEFKRAIAEMNLSETVIKSEIAKGMAIRQLIDKEFVQKVVVPGKEIRTYYDSHPDSFREPEQVRARHILIKVAPQADESQKVAARKKIEEIQEKLKKGQDFATVAQEFSEDSSSAKGGDLGYFGRGEMVKPFEDAAFSLMPGQVSGIVETRFGYHLIKVTERKPESMIAYEVIKDKLEEYLKGKKVQEGLNRYVEELKKKSKVERLLPQTQKGDK